MDNAVVATVAIFLAGIIFAGGRVSARLESLENWRREVRDDMAEIRAALTRLERLMKGEPL